MSGVALRLTQRGEVWLFDCGEGTQHQLLRSHLNLSQLRRIFITHVHGDHVYGLMGLLATCGMAGHASGIDVYGPPGLAEYVRVSAELTETRFSYRVEVHTVEEGRVFEGDEFEVDCRELKHRVTAFGYRVTEKNRPGRFEVEKAREAGIPPGPLYGRLKRGETVELPDGRVVSGTEFTGPTEKGRSFAYCTDTTYCRNSVELACGVDLLIHEATFLTRDEHLARRSMHSTAAMAARVASEAQAGKLLLTHFSPRYVEGNPAGPADLLQEARATFPDTELARDFMTVVLPRHSGPEPGD